MDDPVEWISSFSGTNTRWETVGILFYAFACALLSLPEEEIHRVFREKGEEKNVMVAKIKGCIEGCVELCRGFLNPLVCNLLYKDMLLETVLRGDASKYVCPLLIIIQKTLAMLTSAKFFQPGVYTTTLLEPL